MSNETEAFLEVAHLLTPQERAVRSLLAFGWQADSYDGPDDELQLNPWIIASFPWDRQIDVREVVRAVLQLSDKKQQPAESPVQDSEF